MLDFRITTFLNVCKYMNFTKTADALHITQPAVSQHIHYLEELYETKLFGYNGKKMFLTPSGEALLHAATTMTHDVKVLKEQISGLSKGKEIVSFGATLTVGEFLLPDKLSQYIQEHPSAQIRMQVGNTNELLSMLKNGELDFAIIEGYFPKTDYDYLPFSQEPFIAVCGTAYDLKNPEIDAFPTMEHPVTIQNLFHERLIVREPGSGSRDIFERFLTGINCQVDDFTNTTIVNNIHVIKQLAKNNCGITFLYKAAVKEELKAGLLREIPIKGLIMSHEITFLWNKGSLYQDKFQKYYHLFH